MSPNEKSEYNRAPVQQQPPQYVVQRPMTPQEMLKTAFMVVGIVLGALVAIALAMVILLLLWKFVVWMVWPQLWAWGWV